MWKKLCDLLSLAVVARAGHWKYPPVLSALALLTYARARLPSAVNRGGSDGAGVSLGVAASCAPGNRAASLALCYIHGQSHKYTRELRLGESVGVVKKKNRREQVFRCGKRPILSVESRASELHNSRNFTSNMEPSSSSLRWACRSDNAAIFWCEPFSMVVTPKGSRCLARKVSI